MVAEIQHEWQGLDEVQRKMRDFIGVTQQRAAKSATAAGARVVRDEARRRALASIDNPDTSENIAKNITVQFGSRTTKRTGDILYRTGVRGGARYQKSVGEIQGQGKDNPGGETYYWRFVEFGFTHTNGQSIPARPFMRPAQLETQDGQLAAFLKTFNKTLDRYYRNGSK